VTKFTIGQVATKAQVSTDSIRFYEKKGLISEPPRGANGYRQYPESTIARLMFIKRAKSMGFSLKEIRELLDIQRETSNTCKDAREQVAAKLIQVDEKLIELQRMKGALKFFLNTCDSKDSGSGQCPILEALERQN